MTSPQTTTTGCPHLRFPFPTPERDPLGIGVEWEQARQAGDPVQVLMPDGQVAWLVTGHAAAHTAFRHPDTTRGTADGIRPFSRLGDLIATKDGSEHRRIRRLAAGEFTRTRVARYRPRIVQLAEEFVEAMIETGDQADLLESLGFPLPLTIIGEILGVPEGDREQFRNWADGVLVGADRADEGMAALGAMTGYARSLIERRHRAPADDLATVIGAGAAEAGVGDDDAALLAVAIIVGGFETTAAALASGVYRLLTVTHAGRTAYRYLHDHPEAVPGAVEEILRVVPSTHIGAGPPRRATADIVINGVTIGSGDLIIPAHDAANRDPDVFDRPAEFDLARPNAGDHLSFGEGAHVCMGSNLARLELQIMITTLTRRLPGLRLACEPDDVAWDTETMVRRPRTLPVTWDRPTRAADKDPDHGQDLTPVRSGARPPGEDAAPS